MVAYGLYVAIATQRRTREKRQVKLWILLFPKPINLNVPVITQLTVAVFFVIYIVYRCYFIRSQRILIDLCFAMKTEDDP